MTSKALQLRNLTKTYGDSMQALKGIDLDVDKGDFFALLGPNGAGKSTTIGIICSLINKTEGEVSVYGHDLVAERERVKALIGLVPQEFNFNAFEPVLPTVLNVAGYNGIRRRDALLRAEHFLGKLDLWEKRDVAARNLSGGMKRRLMIARALVHEPKLLILDEPTAGVDIEIRRTMWDFLTELNEQHGTTIILTTHYLEEAEALCRNVAIIDEGRIIRQGSVRTLLSESMLETFVLAVESLPAELPESPHYALRHRNDGDIEADVPRGGDLNGLFAFLTDAGIRVTSMRNKSNRLEAFFLRLVQNKEQAA